MTEQTPEDELAAAALADGPDPEEYDAEGEAAVSPSTGTVYDGPEGDQQPAATPHDDTPDDSDAEDA